MRWERIISVSKIFALRRWLNAAPSDAIPILMYHGICAPRRSNRQPYYETSTSPPIFRQHMHALQEWGYQGISLEEAVDCMLDDMSVRKRLVVLTFDDGYADLASVAWPVMQQFGFKATVFLPTTFIASERRSFMDIPCLTWDEVARLRQEGVRFGSHTATHPKLVDLSWRQIQIELSDSRKTIEDRLGERVTTFAYPYAYPQANRPFRRAFEMELQRAGYQANVTTRIGIARRHDSLFCLKRLPINDYDDLAFYHAKLQGGYDWLGWLQHGWKAMRFLISRKPPVSK